MLSVGRFPGTLINLLGGNVADQRARLPTQTLTPTPNTNTHPDAHRPPQGEGDAEDVGQTNIVPTSANVLVLLIYI